MCCFEWGLFNRYTLCWHSECECSLIVDGGYGEVSLRDDIHANEYVVVEVAVVLAAQYAEVGDTIAIVETEVDEVCVHFDDAVECRDGMLVAWLQTQRGDDFGRDDGVGSPRVPSGVVNLAVAAVAVGVGHTVGHDHEAVGDDGILPTTEVLLQNAHRGRMLEVMTRCALGV